MVEALVMTGPVRFRSLRWLPFVISGRKAVRHRLGLHGREEDMTAVGDDDGPGAAPIRGIDEGAFVSGLLDNALDGRGVGCHDGNDPVGCDDVAEPDIDEPGILEGILHAYSTFCTCSRRLSSSPFTPITARVISRSLALEPIVFASRPIS